MLCVIASIAPESAGRHRYGIVLTIAAATVVFDIVAPNTAASRGVALLLAGGMLLIVVLTSREGDRTRRESAAGLVSLVSLGLAVAVIAHALPQWVAAATAGVLVIATLILLVRALTRMLRDRGVTIQAVAGALAVYLLLGLLFSLVVSIAARVGHGAYFAQGTDGTESQRVYFSFTAMTTTGFGDLTPATQVGRALTVLDMLTGQIYLVTVISLLVGNLRRRGDAEQAAGEAAPPTAG